MAVVARAAIVVASREYSIGESAWYSEIYRTKFQRKSLLTLAKAFGNNNQNQNSEKWEPSLEIAVPEEQRPVNELAALRRATLFSWAQLAPKQFAARLGGIWLIFFISLGGPIAASSFDPSQETLKFILAGGAGALFPVAVLILRIYLGWSYVGDRLLSAVIPYEETGWYDGQMFVKPPEILARDRLLGSYQVKPVMKRLKQTLISTGAILTGLTVALLVFFPEADDIGFSKTELLNPPKEVQLNDDLAASAAAAANGRPVYCTDRYYRAVAGGQYCKWEDLRK